MTETAFLKILRSHYKEKDSTLVFHELSNAVQSSTESEMEFCLRVMSLRERVVSLSCEEECPFDQVMLKKRFFKPLFTGFRHNNVRLELQTILKTGMISDDDLLQELTLVVSTEQERSSKMKSKTNINSVSDFRDSQNSENLKKESKKTEKKENSLFVEINKLSAQVSELSSIREELNELKTQLAANKNETSLKDENLDGKFRQRRRVFKCDNCFRMRNRFCNHCFICGASDHRRNECPTSKNL